MESPTVRPGRTTRIVAAVVVTTVAGILLAATFFRRRRRKSHRKKQNGAVPQKQREAPERNIPMPVRPSDRSTEDGQTIVNVHSQHNGSPPSPSPDRTDHSRTHSTASVSQLADEHIQQSPTEERDEVDGPSLPTPSPQEMIHLGAASIDSALRYWEEALEMKTTQDGEPTEETGRYEDLRSLLKRIKDLCSDYIELSAMNFDPDARVGVDQSDTSL
ncbi:hypothetical protein BSL78_01064 [Apostichopus japonicus]|uniref:Uncharacterized protein n=1 Tax=Stichopus japonicus TaxID=307972 RepID=A0A2G8LP72_STIJA|nr:hypothetical protein BSL78_01064 [Apostichopus japonicus]